MILSGELEINHIGKYSKVLRQYDCDYFDGGWETSAKGKVVDFNLMTSKPSKGDLDHQVFPENTELILALPKNKTLIGLYLISGKFLVKSDSRILNSQDLIIIQNNKESYTLQVLEKSEVIQIYVS